MRKFKILIVDDNPDIVEMFAARLKANDYEVLTAYSGKDACEIAAREIPHAIILDISMPEMDGFETGKKIKENIITQNIPIIMSTALGEQKNILKAISDLGAVAYLVKPFNPQIMLETLKKTLGER